MRPEPIAPQTRHDLAGRDGERDVLDRERAHAVLAVAGLDGDAGQAHRELAQLEDGRGARRGRRARRRATPLPAIDAARPSSTTTSSALVVFAIHGAHGLAVAQHGDAVAEREDLVHAVRDVDARRAGVAQAAQPLHQPIGLVAGERRGGLVEDEDARVVRERAHDLDDLLEADAEHRRPAPTDRCRRSTPNFASSSRARASMAASSTRPKIRARAPPSRPSSEVRRDRQLRHQHQLLVHDGDAGVLGVARGREARSSPRTRTVPP